MKTGIAVKLFLGLLAACAVVVVLNSVAGRISFQRGFLGYLNDQGVERMQGVLPHIRDAYASHGNWEFIRDNPDEWFSLMRPDDTGDRHARMLHAPPVSDQTGAVPRFALLDAQGRHLMGNPDADMDSIRLPVVVGGATVGWFVMVPFQRALASGDVRFYETQLRAWWAIGVASVLVAAILAWWLSRAMLRRVRGLAGAVHRLAAGDYAARIADAGNDELGQLTHDVNRLADTLEHTETTRRAFMADISHELRTPLAVLRAELEAIEDGIRPLQPASIAPLQSQVRQLGKLVDDLHELAMTQSGVLTYRLAPLNIAALAIDTAAGIRGRFADAGLRLVTGQPSPPLMIEGDERRLQQLFGNLLENALRYTDGGGEVSIAATRVNRDAVIIIDDSAPGVPDEARSRLFERFYRVDASRNRASGGSGLGLAISHNIAAAHGGGLRAEASPLGGVRIVLTLPLAA